MADFVTTLKDNHIHVEDNFLRTIAYHNDQNLTQKQYEKLIKILTNVTATFDDYNYAKYTFMYILQNVLWTPEMDLTGNVYTVSRDQAVKLVDENPWMWAAPDDDTPKINEDGSIKRKKGWKQDRALELYRENSDLLKKDIIKIFVKELDMTPSGAQTYYYNAKKKFNS